MSAELNALEAALSYSAKLEQQIAAMKDEIQEQRMRAARLREQVNGVKEALLERDHCQMHGRPIQMDEAKCNEPTKADCQRCKNCGYPI